MKKIIVIFVATIAIVGCSKKVLSGAGNTTSSSSNNEKIGVANTSNNTPVTETKPITPTVVNTNTEPGSQAAKTTREQGQLSPEQQGQATFSAKCGKCHGLKVTTDYTADRWITVMQVMATKANLSAVEKENVLAYVKLNAKKG
jgi:cytochrome c553